MKYQVFFSLKDNEKVFINVCAAVMIGALRVNILSFNQVMKLVSRP